MNTVLWTPFHISMIRPPAIFFPVADCFRPGMSHIFYPIDGHLGYFRYPTAFETTSV